MYEKSAVFIPAYNVARELPEVLKRIPSTIRSEAREIFVVDNQSTDQTAVVAHAHQKTDPIGNLEVIVNPKNLGYGGSQMVAYRRSVDRGYACIAMLHGDAQYAPEFLDHLMPPVIRGEADLVFGSRMLGNPLKGGMPLHRYIGNKILTTLQNLLLGTHLSEFHSGYRVYSVAALKDVEFERLSKDFHFDTEIIILFHERGKKISEVSIPTHYGDEPNHVNIWKYGWDVLVTTGTYFLHKKGLRKSKNWTRILNG